MWQPCADRIEIASRGFDDTLCGVCGPGAQLATGLRVPTVASTSTATSYVFQCCTMPLGGVPWWLVAIAQLLEIGADAAAGTPPTYPVTQRVGGPGGNPNWRFQDARVSWHLRTVRDNPGVSKQTSALETDSFALDWSVSPALVFRTATFPAVNKDINGHPDNYLKLSTYTAPPIRGEGVDALGTFTDVRYPIGVGATKSALEPIPLVGPGFLVLYCVVWQTSTSGRATLPAKFAMPTGQPEESFVSAFTAAQYWRVGGTLTLERRRAAA